MKALLVVFVFMGVAAAQSWRVEREPDPSTGKTQLYAELSAFEEPGLTAGELGVSCFDVDDPSAGGYISVDMAPAGLIAGATDLEWVFDGGEVTPWIARLERFPRHMVLLLSEIVVKEFFAQLTRSKRLEVRIRQIGPPKTLRFDVSGFAAIAPEFGCFQK